MLFILLQELDLLISRLKSPKIIISDISVSIARSIEFSMCVKIVLSEFGGHKIKCTNKKPFTMQSNF